MIYRLSVGEEGKGIPCVGRTLEGNLRKGRILEETSGYDSELSLQACDHRIFSRRGSEVTSRDATKYVCE